MQELFFDNRIAGLILKFLREEITEAESQELTAWIAESPRRKELFDELTHEEKLPADLARYAESRERILQKIYAAAPEARKVVPMQTRFRWKPWLAAAIIIGLAVAGYWMFMNDQVVEKPVVAEQPKPANDVAPGKVGAILTLADGTTIVLDDAQNGNIAQQKNATITKDGGKLTYKGVHISGELEYNTMKTPKGRTYRLELSDGSMVWLNAASSIRYPAAFGNDERKVEVTGEVYFEVAKDPKRRFVVVAGEKTTEVLGTSFNINSYEDEAGVKVTLLEGRIKVNDGNTRSVILKPGEQASLSYQSKTSQGIPVKTADVEQVMAWKNGLFKFRSTPIRDMMRQIERWYDVEVVFEEGIKDDPITGTIERNVNASQALEMLKYAGYRFTINGKKITVMP